MPTDLSCAAFDELQAVPGRSAGYHYPQAYSLSSMVEIAMNVSQFALTIVQWTDL